MNIIFGVLLGTALLAPPAAAQQQAPAAKPAPAPAPAYVPLPKDLQCSVAGLSFTSVVGANGQMENTEGSVDRVTCWVTGKTPEEKKEIPLAATAITRGYLPTKSFGKLKITPDNSITSGGVRIAIRRDELPAFRAFLLKAAAAGGAQGGGAPHEGAAQTPAEKGAQTHAEAAKPQPVVKLPAKYSETKLTAMRPEGRGGFSPYWVAYIVEPEKGSADKHYYVELNGARMGPYENVSSLVGISPDQEHVAFAAQKGDVWTLAVDGVEKYSTKRVYWSEASWSPALQSNVFTNQVKVAVFKFLPGNAFAYLGAGEDGMDHLYVNGVPGPGFSGFSGDISWVHGAVFATGFTNDKPTVLHGAKQFGPYDSVSYEKISEDRQHYAMRVTNQKVSHLLYDDTLIEPKGNLLGFDLGPQGELAYTYKGDGGIKVVFNGQEFPDSYQSVDYVTISPDGKKLAFWATKNSRWMLIAGDKAYPSASGFFIYIAGDRYAVMWSRDSEHVLYYVRNGRGRTAGATAMLDGTALRNAHAPGGFMVMGIIQCEGGEICGEQMMGGSSVEPEALVETALQEGKTACVTESSVMIGAKLSCIVGPPPGREADKNKAPQPSRVIFGEKEEGPYKRVRSALSATKDGNHYGYVVETEQGWQVVVDGILRAHVYEEIYRAYINESEGTYEFLASKGGNLYHVVQPFGAD